MKRPRHPSSSYSRWDISGLAFSPMDSEIDHLIDASGHKLELMTEIIILHNTIQEMMCTSNMSYQFKKFKGSKK